MSPFTSAQTYAAIKREGLLGALQMNVYEWLVHHGACTDTEIAEGLGIPRDSASPRVRELLALGVIEESGVRGCHITGRPCRITRVSGKMPAAPVKKPSVTDMACEAIRIADWLSRQVTGTVDRPKYVRALAAGNTFSFACRRRHPRPRTSINRTPAHQEKVTMLKYYQAPAYPVVAYVPKARALSFSHQVNGGRWPL